jgi:membrane-associated protease RseP (regulator of RpoE activity)
MVFINTILPFVGILIGLVVLHELGHFVVAKLAGVRVEEFGIGMPPRIWGIRVGETLYSINALPLGGFVRLTGEESSQVFVDKVNAESAAHKAGLREGDVIASVNETAVHSEEQLAAHLRSAGKQGPIKLVVQRDEPTDDGRGTELVEYDLVLPTTAVEDLLSPDGPAAPDGGALETPPRETAEAETAGATIGRLAGIQVAPDPRSLGSKSRPIRIAVMAAGAAVNAVLPIFLFALAAMIPQDIPAGPAEITSVVAGAPADLAGLEVGDRFVTINGQSMRNSTDVAREIQLNLGGEIDIVVERPVRDNVLPQQASTTTETERFATTVEARLAPQPLRHVAQPGETVIDVANALQLDIAFVQHAVFGFGLELPAGLLLTFPDGETYTTEDGDTVLGVSNDLIRRQSQIIAASGMDFVNLDPGTVVEISQGATGIRIGNASINLVSVNEGLVDAIGTGWTQTANTLVLLRNRVRSWIAGGESIQLSGPIGIARTTGEVVERAGWLRLIELAALLSLNLAIVNILPLPMLDGGRIVFVLIEVVRRGKRISPEKEGLVHLTGFALLISFVVIVSYFDIVRAIAGESALR